MSQRRSTASSSGTTEALTKVETTATRPVVTSTTSASTTSDPLERAPFVVAAVAPSQHQPQPVGMSSLQLESSTSPMSVSKNLPSDADVDGDDDEMSVEERYQVERHRARVKHWKENPFAAGLVDPTWHDEKFRTKSLYGDHDLQSDETGCLCCSAHLCFKAGRVGNMVVLRSSQEWVEEVEVDDEDGEEKVRRYTRPKLDCVVGPYWPMMVFVTYPIIFGVSGWTLFTKVLPGRLSPLMALGWTVLTLGLIAALAFTACCDPGIQYKALKPPPHQENQWRWTDRAYSFRPRNAFYDVDTAVIVEGFDHTCPWTGTAIGRKNMLPFQVFVCLVFVCMMMNIFLLTGVFDVRFH